MSTDICQGCGASQPTMQCPKCKELGLPASYFCKQECFKANWKTHKDVHKQKPQCTIQTMTDTELLMFNFTGALRPGKITPRRHVPPAILRPDYADHPEGRSKLEETDVKTKLDRWTGAKLDKIRRVCKLSREVLDIGAQAARPGITTDEIDRVIHEATVERGMYPSPLNYYNFPKSVCTSVNEIICHGIPDNRELVEGDILNLDVSSYLDGFHGDLNETVFIGKPSDDDIRLVNCAFECLYAGIASVKPGAMYRHCGEAITARAELDNCGVVRTYCGHGIGDRFHCAPNVPHYAGSKAPGVMQPGHVFTIEPMINLGTWQDVTWPDRWTSATKDGKNSAQFEHTMVVTDNGAELLTDWTDGVPFFKKQLDHWGIKVPKPLNTK